MALWKIELPTIKILKCGSVDSTELKVDIAINDSAPITAEKASLLHIPCQRCIVSSQ